MVDQLNCPITSEEMEEAINRLKNGKAPGPDGYTSRFYKCFKENISGILAALINRILYYQEIPNTWKEANITVIPKDSMDQKDPKNYRPVSLLNLDYKIFAAILAERIFFKKTYIAEEQAGFVPGRHITNNIRSFLNMIEYYD